MYRPHCEALYACTLAYQVSKDKHWLDWLEKINEYIYEHFCDSEHGEWFGMLEFENMIGNLWSSDVGYLDKSGNIFNRCKGGNYKGELMTNAYIL